jgi:hypothetical protein
LAIMWVSWSETTLCAIPWWRDEAFCMSMDSIFGKIIACRKG